ncbi:MAG: hypothetical protein AAF468_06355 [Pseudomonadota bacterium]
MSQPSVEQFLTGKPIQYVNAAGNPESARFSRDSVSQICTLEVMNHRQDEWIAEPVLTDDDAIKFYHSKLGDDA